ncbi:MAG TPA: S41 family peptidase [Pyrinomonadaceae bacterium]|nr:S41 family peptidase [Pyrinomonadaceae bacterium]
MKATLLIALTFLALAPRAAAQVTAVAPPPAEKPPAERRRETFEIVWQTVRDHHFDPTFGGVNWDAVRAEFSPRVGRAQSDGELHRLLQEMLNRLGQSHFNIVPPEAIPALGGEDDAEAGVEEEGGGEEPELPSRDGLLVTERLTHGVGIDVRVINNSVVVTRVEPQSPAARAGLRPGFVLRSIDGRPTRTILRYIRQAVVFEPSARNQIPAEIQVGFLNGPPGSRVAITYLDGRDRLRRAVLARERLNGEMSQPVQSLPPQFVEFEAKRLRRGIGYIRFNVFAGGVMEKFCEALRSMEGAPGVIIDLRGNRGGVIGMIYGMGGLLQPRSVSFGTMSMRGGRLEFSVFPQRRPYTGQVVVLLDGSSQSASEIFAAGLKETGRALVIGERSAGATLPSVAKELPTGAILQYAFADFTTPHGNRLEGVGVKPDIPVRLDRRSLLRGIDPQLEAAINAIEPPVSAGLPRSIIVPAGGDETGEFEKPKEVEAAPFPPEVERILARYVEAIGGRAAIEAVKSRASKGTFEGSFSGIAVAGTVEIAEKAPNKSVAVISLAGFGEVRRGFTGEYGYEQTALVGFREIEGHELEDMRLSSDLHWAVNFRRNYRTMVLKGVEKLEGGEAHMVEATTAAGVPTRLYFDAKTGLLVRRDETYLSDYREVDGVRIPFLHRSGTTVLALKEVRHNAPLEDAAFAERKDCFTR